ncbi:hypothetical protein [Alloalcanivorax mobilis]|uniref:hypothetical protein n=1 Tax=Alloalcanivorax mobilis TaxID=2019569 RepID=UPI000B5B2B1D|nr:hypothetical protein [Alloalcanivorax mobilis]ASK36160.1 hypothetical protein CEK62_18105 [Alcanivorax sp. N3-2A]
MKNARYLLQFGAALAAYMVVLVVSLWLLSGQPPLPWAIALLPMVPAIGVCWVVVRQLRRVDEMQIKVQLEAIGLAFAATALVTFSYGFLEIVGFPKLSMFLVWPLMAVFWLIGLLISRLRYR